jgi:hypothetical protein
MSKFCQPSGDLFATTQQTDPVSVPHGSKTLQFARIISRGPGTDS